MKSNDRRFTIPVQNIESAYERLKKLLPSSPLLFNPWISELYGANVYLKLENMQPIGSFKIRGATTKILSLTPAEKKKGVIAASAGNHAQGVAWGSKICGVSALIVMPKTAPLMKVKNTEMLGAKVILEGENYDEAYEAALKIAKKTGRVFVHAFDDKEVIAGQGTLALELMEQLPHFDMIVGAVGGGGLMAGVSSALKTLKPKVKIVGVQATGCSSMIQSLKKGKPIKLEKVETFADGIAVGNVKELPFQILKKNIDQFLSVDDESTAVAILTLLEKAKVVSEGAGAIGIAALEQIKKQIKGKTVVVIICGGNIDVNVLNRVIDRGLIQIGRRLRVNVLISDRTGSLAKLTAVIADAGANILQAIHDRSEPTTSLDKTEVQLILETRGQQHSEEVLKILEKNVVHMNVHR